MRRSLRNMLKGAGSILNLFPAPSAPIELPKFLDRTDAEAIESDWKAICDWRATEMKETDDA